MGQEEEGEGGRKRGRDREAPLAELMRDHPFSETGGGGEIIVNKIHESTDTQYDQTICELL